MAENEATFHFGKLVDRKTTRCRPDPRKRARKRWLRENRYTWENGKLLNERFRFLVKSED